MHVIGELDDVFGKEVNGTSRGGGTLVTICSKEYLSMVEGTEVGLELASVDLSIAAGTIAGGAKSFKND